MPPVPYFAWTILDPKTGKRRRARWLMTEATAASRSDSPQKASETPVEYRDGEVRPYGSLVTPAMKTPGFE